MLGEKYIEVGDGNQNLVGLYVFPRPSRFL